MPRTRILLLRRRLCKLGETKSSSAKRDAWVLQFRLLMGGCRKKCLSILKSLRDRHLEPPGQPLDNYHMKTLLLYECEKHPRETDWAQRSQIISEI